MIKLITVSDDRSGRKGGKYGATQRKIQKILDGWIDMEHYGYNDFRHCDRLMAYPDAAKTGGYISLGLSVMRWPR